jgi:hypothetical protein
VKWNYNRSGWASLLLFTLFACLWGFWGIIENFYEGWYYTSVWMNLKLMFYQYLSPVLLFLILGLLLIYCRRWSILFILLLGGWIIKYYGNWFYFLPFLPSAILGYWGNIDNKKLALKIHLIAPICVIILAGIEPVYRVSTRIKKHTGETVLIHLNNHDFIRWAQEGPGWDHLPHNWYEAVQQASRIDSTGAILTKENLHIWRLPTIEEAVLSLHRHGTPAGGVWNSRKEKAEYKIMPDKEFPMWKRHAPIIYWWLASTPKSDTSYAYMISANGIVKKVKKKAKAGYYGFRAIKTVE